MQNPKLSKYVILFLLPLLFILNICGQTTHKFIVTGKIIDETGKPSENAGVTLDSRLSCEKWRGWEDIRNNTSTDENGDFRIEVPQSSTSHIEFLYVASPTKGLNPIFPPFLNDCHSISFAAPFPVLLEPEKEIDAGNLSIQIYYSPVTIYLIDKNNQSFLKNKDLSQIRIRYTDIKGRFAAEKTLDEDDLIDAVDTSLGSITTSMPEGTWQMEIYFGGKSLYKTGKLLVKKDFTIRKIIRL